MDFAYYEYYSEDRCSLVADILSPKSLTELWQKTSVVSFQKCRFFYLPLKNFSLATNADSDYGDCADCVDCIGSMDSSDWQFADRVAVSVPLPPPQRWSFDIYWCSG